jgi:hypothetical protein
MQTINNAIGHTLLLGLTSFYSVVLFAMLVPAH